MTAVSFFREGTDEVAGRGIVLRFEAKKEEIDRSDVSRIGGRRGVS